MTKPPPIRTIAEFEKEYFPIRTNPANEQQGPPKAVASLIANDLLKAAKKRLKRRLAQED